MILESLTVRRFRNLEDRTLSFPPGLTVVHGKNAQGKTNLLEAVFAVVTGHSHRAFKDQELIAFGQAETVVEAVFRRPSGTLDLALHVSATRRRERRRNGKSFRPGEDPLGDPRVILFSPEDLLLVQGPPAQRRRFIDQDLGQLFPSHQRLVREYARALAQRNGALKAGRADLLPAFNAVWAPLAIRLADERERFVRSFLPSLVRAHREIAPEDGPLTLSYLSGLQGQSVEDVLLSLRQREREELARKTTAMGPHRDDIRLLIGDNDLRAYGSQGQQRTAAVAMKVAAVAFAEEREGRPPLLLLDDVLSELDQGRRESLARVVREGQAILTTADDGTLPSGLHPSAILVVERGRVILPGTHWPGDAGPS